MAGLHKPRERNDHVLGASALILTNMAKAVEGDVFDIDVNTDEGLAEFASRLAVTAAHVQHRGWFARSSGSARRYAEEEIVIQGKPISVYQSHSQQWNRVDGVMPGAQDRSSREFKGDEATRMYVMTEWHQNSCAEDAGLAVAILLNVGRLHIDQIPLSRWPQLRPEASLMRHIVAAPWGLLSQKQRNELRNQLSILLDGVNPGDFPLHRNKAVTAIMEYCFKDLPQLSWTSTRVQKCCDDVETPGPKHFRYNKIELSAIDRTAEKSINDFFRYTTKSNDSKMSCSNGTKCTHVHLTQLHVVIDRLPPRLMVYCNPGMTENEAMNIFRMADVITVNYNHVDSPRRKLYKLIGVVFSYISHHFVRWRDPASDLNRDPSIQPQSVGRDILQFDGIKQARCDRYTTWYEGLSINDGDYPKIYCCVFEVLPRHMRG